MNQILEAEIIAKAASTVLVAVVLLAWALNQTSAANLVEETEDPANYLFTNQFQIIILSSVSPACLDAASFRQGKIKTDFVIFFNLNICLLQILHSW